MCDYCINQVNLYTQADPKAKAIGFPECACQNNYQCTVRNIHNYLISKGMKKEVLTEQWTLNHFNHIVWKLASYERNLNNIPDYCKLTLENVIR